MKNGTKIAIVGLLGVGVYLYLRSRKKSIQKTGAGAVTTGTGAVTTGTGTGQTNVGTTLSGPNTTNHPTNVFIDDSIPSSSVSTNSSTSGTASTHTTQTFPTTTTQANPCAPQDGFTVSTFSSTNSNITRVKQQCEKDGGNWVSTRTGGCCIKAQLPPTPRTNTTIGAPTSSTTISSNSCFIKDTLVTLSDNTKIKIQDINPKMDVLSFNEETKNQEVSKVLNTLKSRVNEALVTITTKSGIKISCTSNHPFWLANSSVGWIKASLLEKGDMLLSENGNEEEIDNIDISNSQEIEVYNLTIADNSTYYANGILVHNKDLVFGQTYYGQQAQDIVGQLQNMLLNEQYQSYYSPGTAQYAYNAYVSV